ncbi:MAG: DTW domain-containing protein [Opitutaceae bacterium]|nr:DTW domain-containing protein [Opitutaceae bacterium]
MRRLALRTEPRCSRCLLPPRWCVCVGAAVITTPLQVDIVIHDRERHRPSSTGNLIARVLPGTRLHPWRNVTTTPPAAWRLPGRELWILHPRGAPPPARVDPAGVQAVLLDGAWTEAAAMARVLAPEGRLVALPMAGESRYWLRAQADAGRFSTAEALMFLLRTLGLDEAHDALRVQFELHVYAHLRARGRAELAAAFLADSPLRSALPDLIAQLNTRRPR